MAGLTLAEARTLVLGHLDDDNSRWSSTEVDVALKGALSRCLSDYAAVGGERFDEEASGTTSASDGTVSLSSTPPVKIKSVSVLVGDATWPIYPVAKVDKEAPDLNARSVRIMMLRDYALPSTTSHPIVGVGASAANTWHGFDAWICARAALALAIKDAESRPELRAEEQDLRQSALLRPRIPSARRFPSPEYGLTRLLRWTWIPSTNQLQLCRAMSW